MNIGRHSVALAALATSLAASGGAYAQDKPGVVVAEEVDTVATVVSVDYESRNVVLQGPAGDLLEIKVPDAAQNLDQVEVGDHVLVRYFESTAILVTDGQEGPPSAEQVDVVELAPKGAPARGTAAQVTQISATVEAIDYEQRWVRVRGPLGRLVKLNVPESVERFPNIRVGDQVVVRHTEAIALTLRKR